MDLFEYNYMQRGEQNAPLASRMRPVVLDEFVGQEHIIAINYFIELFNVTN